MTVLFILLPYDHGCIGVSVLCVCMKFNENYRASFISTLTQVIRCIVYIRYLSKCHVHLFVNKVIC